MLRDSSQCGSPLIGLPDLQSLEIDGQAGMGCAVGELSSKLVS